VQHTTTTFEDEQCGHIARPVRPFSGPNGSDRRGIAGSIVGRMRQQGGTAVIRSAPGEGTEVELHMPVAGGT
jgi:hypothetical protein